MLTAANTGTAGNTPANGGENAIGLSNPQYSSGRRKMLDLVNRLHSTGAHLDIDLPVIAVIGSQSAGKSSLIESISGITLPRASGTCTRAPTECKLSWSAEPWKCVVSLRFITDEHGQPLGLVRNEAFGAPIFDKTQVEERIRRAQRAVLSPSTSPREFLDGDDEDPIGSHELTFSTNCVSLQISGNDVADLSFVDLPGLIASVGKGGSSGDIDLVKNLVTSYISRPSCIILLTVACETDFENQGAHTLAKAHDPEGKRTIGVLTKPDRIPPGEEDRWLRFIRNEYEALDNGWFSVKQPDSRALASGISWTEARKEEQLYFTATPPWSELDFESQRHLGTSRLTDCLSTVLSSLIAKRLPELQDELQALLQKTEENLRKLPKPPSSDAFAEILHLLGDFSRDLARHLAGTPDDSGLLQAIRPVQEHFKKAIRDTAPDFRPYTKTKANTLLDEDTGLSTFEPPDFLVNEEPAEVARDGLNTIYIDEVMDRARKAITRELPDHYPFVVSNDYIVTITSKWQTPTRNLFDAVERILTSYVKKIISRHFGKFVQGGMQQQVTNIVVEYIKTCCDATMSRVSWLLEIEQRPWTLNQHYYSDYRDKFLAYYRGYRQSDATGSLKSKLNNYRPPAYSGKSAATPVLPELQVSMSKVLSGLSEVGIHGVKPSDLPKLLPADPYEPALNIMAAVRAYFQVAYKRFVDYVPMAIDYELVLGLDRNGALENQLLKGLGITGTEGSRRCKDLLEEPPNIVMRRQDLEKRWERLDTAKKELMDVWL
ncbi:P-loop containing nucleoside triphosphate hydrolase protein [Amylocystis lapponica]|nr:P-loop containing nucleoside triphosphate hydrolase protein [Amylocystis lapponica]